MKYYLMKVKRIDNKIDNWYGHEILYINKRPMIFNYVENRSYSFGGNLNSEYFKWTEVTADEILEILDELMEHRNTEYYKNFAKVNGITIEELNKDMKNLKKFRATVFKNRKDDKNAM